MMLHNPPKRAVTAIVLVLAVVLAGSVPSVALFREDEEEAIAYLENVHYWQREYYEAYEWDADVDGETITCHRLAGYQTKYHSDNILTTRKYLGLAASGFEFGMTGSSIVAVALSQLGLDWGIETRDAIGYRDDVMYNEWFYGHPVYNIDSNGNGRYDDPDGTFYPWCAVFVAWCADQCGYIENGLFKRTAGASDAYNYLTRTQGFASYPTKSTTPMGGSEYTPVPGDIIFFARLTGDRGSGAYNHVGIIVAVEADGIYTVEGNSNNRVSKNHYTASSARTVLEGDIVHVEYPDESGTTEQNKGVIYNFCTQVLGLNGAATCGVMANIGAESGFDPAIVEIGVGAGYGICQWSFSRRDSLEAFLAERGFAMDSLSGQLYFMKSELESSYKSSVYDKLLSIPNTAEGAYEAGRIWCLKYESPKNKESESVRRGNLAKRDYWPQWGCIGID